MLANNKDIQVTTLRTPSFYGPGVLQSNHWGLCLTVLSGDFVNLYMWLCDGKYWISIPGDSRCSARPTDKRFLHTILTSAEERDLYYVVHTESWTDFRDVGHTEVCLNVINTDLLYVTLQTIVS